MPRWADPAVKLYICLFIYTWVTKDTRVDIFQQSSVCHDHRPRSSRHRRIMGYYRLVQTCANRIRWRVPCVCCRVLLTSAVASHFAWVASEFLLHNEMCRALGAGAVCFSSHMLFYVIRMYAEVSTLRLISQFHFIDWNAQREQAEGRVVHGQYLDLTSTHYPLVRLWASSGNMLWKHFKASVYLLAVLGDWKFVNNFGITPFQRHCTTEFSRRE